MRIRLTLASLLLAATALGQPATDTQPHPAPTSAAATATAVQDLSSQQVRDRLMDELRNSPPELGMVLKLQPSLLTNREFLSSYPTLATFLEAHPQVTHAPRFYFENVSLHTDYQPDPPNIRMWDRTMRDFTAFLVFVIVTATLVWLIKTLTEQRRWSRVAMAQKETTAKLLDRFGSSEELVAYLQSPAGKSLLESVTDPVVSTPRTLSAPLSRIFWSVQAGLVAGVAGVGTHIVSLRVPPDMAAPLSAIGVLMFSIGVGFILSAIASFILSRRLGLWMPPNSAPAAGGD